MHRVLALLLHCEIIKLLTSRDVEQKIYGAMFLRGKNILLMLNQNIRQVFINYISVVVAMNTMSIFSQGP